jgi:hypothetical protein
MTTQLETDYLIIGSGAVGMAFADTLLTETDARIVIVDRNHKPGGHWNQAYSFVTLHQPSSFYGVSSQELCKGRKEKTGLNRGMMELATGAEVSAYFDDVMRHTFLPSGRVSYYPLCNYEGDGEFVSLLTNERFRVASKKTVDATWLNTTVPLTHKPNFSVAPEVQFMPPNHLPQLREKPAGFVVIGGGKTGIDTCLWLLENGVHEDAICWIVSRDAWLLNRRNVQPTEEFFADSIGAQAAQYEAIAGAASIEDMFDRLEAAGYFLRVDTSVRPGMFHGAIVSEPELEQLRRIRNVVRLGHVKSLEADRIVLAQGTVPTSPQHVHVDCSASAIKNLKMKPVFAGDTITPQTVRPYQPVFSAAFIAHVDACYDDEETMNRICGVVPLPNNDADFLHFTLASMINQQTWSKDPGLRAWNYANRLDGFTRLVADVREDDAEKMAILARMRDHARPAMMKLQQLIAGLEECARHGQQTGR